MKVVFLGASNPETVRMIRALERAQPGFEALGFVDNDPKKKGSSFHGYPVFGGMEAVGELVARGAWFVNLITRSTKLRYETSRDLAGKGAKFANFVHPAIDLTLTQMGVGNYIQEGVIVQAGARIGDNSSIHIASLIAHECIIGSSVFIAHAVSLSGLVEVGDGTMIGTNATVLSRLKIGKWATIGAGAVVTKDVPDYTVVVGNPAKVLRVEPPTYTHGDMFEGLPR